MSQFVRGFGANNELLAAWTNTDSSIPTQEIVFVPAAGTQAFAIVGNEQDFASTYSAVDVADESGRALPAHLRKGGLKTDSASSPVSIVSTASLSSRASTAEDAQSTISSSYGSGLYQSESDSLSPRSLHVPSPWSKTLAWQSHAKVPADDALSIASGEMRDTFRNPWKRWTSIPHEHVGGRNIDYALLKHFATEFKDKYKIDVLSNPKAMFRLAAGCDRVTKVLSLQAFEAAETQAFWLRCDGTYNVSSPGHTQRCGVLTNIL
ncbi:hypothetical protein L227DRAFT_652301, partial [Lentinus tigrinus ALCF2SS1-6]